MRRIALVSTVAALAAFAATASPAAASYYHRCSIGDGRGYHVTYLTSLQVHHTTCRTGRRVVRAYNTCRRESGGVKGRCHHRVLHYRCKETRGYGRGQFTAKVTCTRGSRRVRFTYTQFT